MDTDLRVRAEDGSTAPVTPARPRRAALVALLLIGIGMVAAPIVLGMFSRAPQGATMLADFRPFMTADRLAGFQGDIASINDAVAELDAAEAPATNPSYASFSAAWPAIGEDMGGLMDQVAANRVNYEAVAGLPSFSLFPWFFVGPGVVVAALAGLALVRGRWTASARIGIGLLGVGLVIAPLAFGMFSRAPKGAEMMRTFETIETTENVQRIQGYFSTMAVGQGSIRLEVVPALEKSGLSGAQIAAAYPATTALNKDWVHILNDMTPMIGAMSDNVGHYRAISGLPRFGLFPWFFVAPGGFFVLLALAAGRPGRLSAPEGVS